MIAIIEAHPVLAAFLIVIVFSALVIVALNKILILSSVRLSHQAPKRGIPASGFQPPKPWPIPKAKEDEDEVWKKWNP
jgi:hypothetical protein